MPAPPHQNLTHPGRTREGHPDRCPVTALHRWQTLTDITNGPLFRPVAKSNTATHGR